MQVFSQLSNLIIGRVLHETCSSEDSRRAAYVRLSAEILFNRPSAGCQNAAENGIPQAFDDAPPQRRGTTWQGSWRLHGRWSA